MLKIKNKMKKNFNELRAPEKMLYTSKIIYYLITKVLIKNFLYFRIYYNALKLQYVSFIPADSYAFVYQLIL